MNVQLKYGVLFCICIITPSLAQPRPKPMLNPPSSQVDIEYSLGRDQYRLTFETHGDTVLAKSYRDKKIVENGPINSQKFPDFLKKVSETMGTLKGEKTQGLSCQSPFTVTLKLAGQVQIVKGCRSNDQGHFSKLIRDGEFLMYSKN